MKASIKFREDRPPLVRAKVPVGILGISFVSGVVAAPAADGDTSSDLRLDLSTAFRAGPSLRLSYRPNDSGNPFSLVLKTGVGAYGSPSADSSFSMSAEFGLLGPRPTFSLLLKPRFGDFSLRKSVSAAPAVAVAPTTVSVKVQSFVDGQSVERPLVDFPQTTNGFHSFQKGSGFPLNVSASTFGSTLGGINELLSGVEVSARSIISLPSRTAVHFKWGLRVPPEFRTAFEGPTAGISVRKLPLLVISKISVERSGVKTKEKKNAWPSETAEELCGHLRKEVESLQAGTLQLRRIMDDVRAELRDQKAAPLMTGKDQGKSLAKALKSVDMSEEPLEAQRSAIAHI
ncbi:uncharacterized protein LOC122002098 [Zingiber officinale]|uniref:Uncharacterized protein n=1 Tax=Zingiber officinale TaxID=94328 RepID=A0A8J5IKP6_ZINOF|nr:uncharacterized protein LOC122002098 [Zingiber officinale]KAG6536974.1 hypothetical protein ZIOFF_002052 [Zingiber officinale]